MTLDVAQPTISQWKGAFEYERRRVSTVVVTWVLIGSALLVSVFFGLFESFNSVVSPDIEPAEMTDVFSGVFNPVSLLILGAIGAQAFSSEYKYATMRTALTAVPDRTKLFVAKMGTSLALATAAWLVMVVLAYVLAAVSPASIEFLPGALVRSLVVVWGWVILVSAITVVTRSLPLTLLVLFVLLGFIEKMPGIIKIAPFTNGLALLGGPEGALPVIVWLVWMVVGAVGSWWFFSNRDA